MPVYTSLADLLKRISGLARGVVSPGLALFLMLPTLFAGSGWAGEWMPLNGDGIHDPRSRAVKILQQPGDALKGLTPDNAGNQVRWVQVLGKGEIKPREKLFPQTEVRKLDLDIIMDVKGGMPAVRFPHRPHTEWLDCVNCHEGLFASKIGMSKISMFKILQGEQCGVCHGAVAFPLTECARCHSVPRPGNTKPEIPAGIDPSIHLGIGQGRK
jgi:c(7)-type cytochrome triheme protein